MEGRETASASFTPTRVPIRTAHAKRPPPEKDWASDHRLGGTIAATTGIEAKRMRALSRDRGDRTAQSTQRRSDLHGYTASYSSVPRFADTLRGRINTKNFAIVHTDPGEEAQANQGAAPLVRHPEGGKDRSVRLFVMTLDSSRKCACVLGESRARSSGQSWTRLRFGNWVQAFGDDALTAALLVERIRVLFEVPPSVFNAPDGGCDVVVPIEVFIVSGSGPLPEELGEPLVEGARARQRRRWRRRAEIYIGITVFTGIAQRFVIVHGRISAGIQQQLDRRGMAVARGAVKRGFVVDMDVSTRVEQ